LNFVHVSDVANLFYLVAKNNVTGVFNCTDSHYVTAKEFCEGIATYLKVETKREDFEDWFKYCFAITQKMKTSRAEEIGWKLEYKTFLDNVGKVYSELNS